MEFAPAASLSCMWDTLNALHLFKLPPSWMVTYREITLPMQYPAKLQKKKKKKKKGFHANNILHLILQGVGSRRNAGAATSETAGDSSAVKLCDHLETFGCDIKASDWCCINVFTPTRLKISHALFSQSNHFSHLLLESLCCLRNRLYDSW